MRLDMLCQIVGTREPFCACRVRAIEWSFEGMSLDVSLQVLQTLESLGAPHHRARVMLSRPSMLATIAIAVAAATASVAIGSIRRSIAIASRGCRVT